MSVQEVKSYIRSSLQQLQRLPEHPQKAALANLRRGIGKAPGDIPDLWGIFLQDMPEEMQSKTGDPTREEWAVYMALTLYAMHQQGCSANMDQEERGYSFGRSVRRLVPSDQEPGDSSIIKRLNALATATQAPEIAHHLRGIIQLLRADDIPLDYPQLGADLYLLQTASAPNVRLRWGQDFYSFRNDQMTSEEKGEIQ